MKNNSNLKKMLQQYSIAGAACLAARAADAQIIYTNIPDTTFGPNTIGYFDLNNDGILDFKFSNATYTSYWIERINPGFPYTDLGVMDAQSHRPLALNYGDTINVNQFWAFGGDLALRGYHYGGTSTNSYSWGQWINVQNKFLGLRIKIAGEYHYGWARLNVHIGNLFGQQNKIKLKDYAYNSQPNQSIFAGQMPVCVDNYEPNDAKQQAVQIQTNQEYNALINSTLDVDWFKFDVISSEPNVRIRLYDLPKNYNIFLYNPSGTKIGSSKHTGTKPDTIVANGLTAGTYSVKVRAKAGHFDPNNCYSLIAETSDSPWKLAAPQNDIEDVQFELFPNPASQQLTIQCDDENIVTVDVSIYNMIGQQVRALKNLAVHNAQSSINISELPQGEYLIRISFGDGVEVKKFIVNR